MIELNTSSQKNERINESSEYEYLHIKGNNNVITKTECFPLFGSSL